MRDLGVVVKGAGSELDGSGELGSREDPGGGKLRRGKGGRELEGSKGGSEQGDGDELNDRRRW